MAAAELGVRSKQIEFTNKEEMNTVHKQIFANTAGERLQEKPYKQTNKQTVPKIQPRPFVNQFPTPTIFAFAEEEAEDVVADEADEEEEAEEELLHSPANFANERVVIPQVCCACS